MKILNTEISKLTNRLVSVEMIENPFLQCPFHSQPEYHAHPEIELLYIIKGTGTRIINGKIDQFKDGEMIFMGPNVPHVWIRDIVHQTENAKAILLYFNIENFNELFRTMPHFSDIDNLIRLSARGIEIKGETKLSVAEKLVRLMELDGFPQMEGVLSILNMLSQSSEFTYITDNHQIIQKKEVSDRVLSVVKYINDHLAEPITLESLSQVAYMSENALCRFFKNSLKMNVSSYIQQQRIIKACSLLVETEKPVAAIADSCGYASASHFAQVFRKKMKISPLSYRKKVLEPQL